MGDYRKRAIRLTIFAFCTIFMIYLILNFGLAGLYSYILCHPPCRTPQKSIHLPDPEIIWLNSRDGVQVRAWYYPSYNRAAIIAMGGMEGALGKNLPKIDFLVGQGYGVLQIDSRACSQPKAIVTLGGNEVFDALAAVDFLSMLPDIDQIGAFGFSMGAVSLIRTAAVQDKIQAIVAEGGYYNLGNDFIDSSSWSNPVSKIFLYSIGLTYWVQTGINPWTIDPIQDLTAIAPRPVYLIYGEYEAVSGKAQMQFEAARNPKLLWIIPGADHGETVERAPLLYYQNVSDFFNQYLLIPNIDQPK